MQPIRSRVFVIPNEISDKTEKGIFKPEFNNQKPVGGIVAAVGPGTPVDPMEAQAGRLVYYTPGMGEMVEIDGIKYLVLDEEQILYSL